MGDLRELPAQARPLPHAPVLPGGGKDVPRRRQQAPHHQRHQPGRLPGGGCALPGQEVSAETVTVAMEEERAVFMQLHQF